MKKEEIKVNKKWMLASTERISEVFQCKHTQGTEERESAGQNKHY